MHYIWMLTVLAIKTEHTQARVPLTVHDGGVTCHVGAPGECSRENESEKGR